MRFDNLLLLGNHGVNFFADIFRLLLKVILYCLKHFIVKICNLGRLNVQIILILLKSFMFGL